MNMNNIKKQIIKQKNVLTQRRYLFILSTILLFFNIHPPLMAQIDRLSDVLVIAESSPVVIEKKGRKVNVSEFGVTVSNGDEIDTGTGGRAFLLMSLLSDANEIYLASSTKIRFTTEIMNSDLSIQHIHLIYGKIRARIQTCQNIQVRIHTEEAEVVTNEGEFIVESNDQLTNVGTLKGAVKMISNITHQEIMIPQKAMSSTSLTEPDNTFTGFIENLYEGVEFSDSKKTAEMVVLAKKQQEETKSEEMAIGESENTPKESRFISIPDQIQTEDQPDGTETHTVEVVEKPEMEKEQPKEDQKELMVIESETEEQPDDIAKEEQQPDDIAIIETGDFEDKDASENESFFFKYKWHITATSLFLISGYLSYEEARKYNDLDSENDDLMSQYSSASDSVKEQIFVKYKVNQEKMTQYKRNVDYCNYVTFLAFLWESYLIYDLIFGENSNKQETAFKSNSLQPARLAIQTGYSSSYPTIKLSAEWKW